MNKTLAKVGYAPLTISEDGSYSYSDPVYFKTNEAGGREVSSEANGEPTTIYADGLPAVTGEDNQGYKVKVQLLALIDDIETAWLGNKKSTDGSIIEKNDVSERPRFALIVAKERFKGSTTYEIDIYLNCVVSKRPSRSDKTSEGKLDPQFPEFEISAEPRLSDKIIRVTTYANALPTKIPTITETNDDTTGA